MTAFPAEKATAGCTDESIGANPINDAIWQDLNLLTYTIHVY
jgi:hypothetical protein